MSIPKITRPEFPKGYVDHPVSSLTWDWVAARLTESRHYWVCSVRPNGKPHVVPRWGAFIDDKFYYDGSPETRHARNIESNPNVSLHLESGVEAIILEGISETAPRPSKEFAGKFSQALKKKYAELGYSPEPNQWDNGGLYVFTPRQCIAWSNFTQNPTKFIFDNGEQEI